MEMRRNQREREECSEHVFNSKCRSMKMSLLLYRFPVLLDAAAKLIEKRGSKFLVSNSSTHHTHTLAHTHSYTH